jgi:hypothetical protein
MADSIVILFFTAGSVPTAEEEAQINALEKLTRKGYSVEVRNAEQSALYGANLEDCDYVCGAIPADYDDIAVFGVDYLSSLSKAGMLECIPAFATIQKTHTLQLQVIRTVGETVEEMIIHDFTASLSTTATGEAGKATISAGGLITGVDVGEVDLRVTVGSLAATCKATITAHTS